VPRLRFGDLACERHEEESVLDALLRAGAAVSYACKAGSCGSCLVKAAPSEPVPAKAQAGLKDAFKAGGYFLACSCYPEGDFAAVPAGADARSPARVERVERLTPSVLRVRLACDDPSFAYRAGQYLTLFRDDGLARSYSIASLPGEPIELHVRLVPGGRLSGWLAAPEAIGAMVQIQGPSGECCYIAGREDQPMLLVGTGTGLAPLYGILRDAIRAGHRGPVHLYHGALNDAGFYLQDELRTIAGAHAGVHYVPTTLEREGPLDTLLRTRHPNVAGHRASCVAIRRLSPGCARSCSWPARRSTTSTPTHSRRRSPPVAALLSIAGRAGPCPPKNIARRPGVLEPVERIARAEAATPPPYLLDARYEAR
jgi:NAD(P)H-flavin reductase/ferredoxin